MSDLPADLARHRVPILQPPPPSRGVLNLQVVGTVGIGATRQAAEDQATINLGMGGLNLVPLRGATMALPMGTVVEPWTDAAESKIMQQRIFGADHPLWGFKANVLAVKEFVQDQSWAACTVGWIQITNKAQTESHGGFMAVASAFDKTAADAVERSEDRVRALLGGMATRRGLPQPPDTSIHRLTVHGQPDPLLNSASTFACVLALAAISVESWV